MRRRAVVPALGLAALAVGGCGSAHVQKDYATSSTSAPGPTATATPILGGTAPTSAPATTGSTTSASAAPTTTTRAVAAPTVQAALSSVVAAYHGTYAVSPVAGQDRQQLVAVDHEVPGAAGGDDVRVDVYAWTGAALVRQAAVTLGDDGSTGLLLPAAQAATPITVVGVTGAATPDFAVTTAGASAVITSLVSDATGTWRAVPFVTPQGVQVGVASATIRGRSVLATFDDCSPNCAQGGTRTVTFSYSGGRMVAATA